MTLSPQVLKAMEVLVLASGVAYAVLGARRNRLCWIVGGVSSACAAVVMGLSALPMQCALQLYFVGMSFYGWFNWTRSSARGELPVGTWPLRNHLLAGAGLALLSVASARVLASETQAAWPLLDSLTAWFSLLGTWLAARARVESWLYWIVIDALSVFLCYQQGRPIIAMLYVLFVVIAASGFVAWRRRLHAQVSPA